MAALYHLRDPEAGSTTRSLEVLDSIQHIAKESGVLHTALSAD